MPVDTRRLRHLPLLSAAAVLSGCASFTGAPDFPTASQLDTLDPLYNRSVMAFYLPNANRKDVRNQFIEIRSALIDRNYSDFKRRLHTERVSSAVGTDWTTLLLGSVAAGASAPSAKTAAGAVTALVSGGKSSVDKNVYFDRALPAMLSQMEARRAEIRHQILNGMQLEAERYSLLQAKADLHDYFDAGTITGAISQMTTTAATRQGAAEDKLKQRTEAELTKDLLGKGFDVRRAATDDLSKLLKKCINPTTGELDPSVKPTVHALLKLEGISTPTPLDVIDLAINAKRHPSRAKLFSSEVVAELFNQCPS